MIEANMPQDIMKYKTKFVGNFSMRESICAGLGICVGLFGWFTIFSGFSQYPRMICTAILVFPFFFAGFFKPLGMPAEKALTTILVDNFFAPVKRRNEIRHPEYEKFEKYEGCQFLQESNDENCSIKKKNKEQAKLMSDVKVKPSKQYKALR